MYVVNVYLPPNTINSMRTRITLSTAAPAPSYTHHAHALPTTIHIYNNESVLDVMNKTVPPILQTFTWLSLPPPLKIQIVHVLIQIPQTTFILWKTDAAKPKKTSESQARHERRTMRPVLLEKKEKVFRKHYVLSREILRAQGYFLPQINLNNLEPSIFPPVPSQLCTSETSK